MTNEGFILFFFPPYSTWKISIYSISCVNSCKDYPITCSTSRSGNPGVVVLLETHQPSDSFLVILVLLKVL
ncbi:uncharacterized protein LAJ45_10915 [Morchella importuna]|uniref:uncharacterized protein n=1 Tax=Morchella importuna TaxID=1174673 RepID=UPI001E8E7633|nr:uncharacterized protein LAJ45_10915 [Morchella importuna]KAH8145135.1 hypothetical protein LAJ45_10915 [Morchella importuna]